jgi:hypothetical protein
LRRALKELDLEILVDLKWSTIGIEVQLQPQSEFQSAFSPVGSAVQSRRLALTLEHAFDQL